MIVKTPCYECPDRARACAEYCERYAAYKRRNIEHNREMKVDSMVGSFAVKRQLRRQAFDRRCKRK